MQILSSAHRLKTTWKTMLRKINTVSREPTVNIICCYSAVKASRGDSIFDGLLSPKIGRDVWQASVVQVVWVSAQHSLLGLLIPGYSASSVCRFVYNRRTWYSSVIVICTNCL